MFHYLTFYQIVTQFQFVFKVVMPIKVCMRHTFLNRYLRLLNCLFILQLNYFAMPEVKVDDDKFAEQAVDLLNNDPINLKPGKYIIKHTILTFC